VKDDLRWLTPGVKGIGAASLLSDLGHEVPTALLPRLITSLGGSAAALGFIEGISDGLSGLMRLLGGAIADDPVRRRSAAVGGYTVTALLSSLIGVAVSVWQVGFFRAGAWAARGLRGPSRNPCSPTPYQRQPMDELTASSAPWTISGRSAALCWRWL